MRDIPSDWAMAEARRYIGLPHREDSALVYRIAAALDAARAEGRSAGIEEAAREVHMRGMHLPDLDQRLEHERTERCVRSLLDSPDKGKHREPAVPEGDSDE